MFHHSGFRLGVLLCLAAPLVHCASPSDDTSASSTDPDDGASVEKQAEGLMALPARCYAKMLRPAPYDYDDQPIGLAMTLRINRACDRGAPLVNRKVRIYIRRFEVNGTPGPQILLKDWTDVSAQQYRLDIPWTAGTAADGSTLAPGRYQIYAYSLNASLYQDWVLGDAFARNMSTRSDNTYVTLKQAGTWSPDGWGACSAACGGGTQTRTVPCKDGSGATVEARMCLATAPSASQACNMDTCGPTPEESCSMSGGTWDGTTCQYWSPAMDCMMMGGIWMGSYCDYPWMHGIPGIP